MALLFTIRGCGKTSSRRRGRGAASHRCRRKIQIGERHPPRAPDRAGGITAGALAPPPRGHINKFHFDQFEEACFPNAAAPSAGATTTIEDYPNSGINDRLRLLR